MKIGIISDLHIPHWHSWDQNAILDNIMHFVLREKPDLMIDAGDSEVPTGFNGVPQVTVLGNHDWYGHQFKRGANRTSDTLDNGMKIAGCTLWTDYNDGDALTMHQVTMGLADGRCIDGYDASVILKEHKADVAFLRKQKADIIVTHHLPTLKSVHPRWRKEGIFDLLNYGFASNLDELIEELQPTLWVHGHTHDKLDYTIGRTRVVCNPCGYSHERLGKPYEPVFVDV